MPCMSRYPIVAVDALMSHRRASLGLGPWPVGVKSALELRQKHALVFRLRAWREGFLLTGCKKALS